MFLSIIIPHYNIESRLLERCIDSIIGQGITAGEYEVIIIDDGSAIPPSWIAGTYKDANVKFIEAPHGGPGAARNKGMQEARGRYIMFVDADDFLISNGHISQCLEILKTEKPQILRYRYHVTEKPDRLKPKRDSKVTTGNTISGAAFMASNNLPGSPCLYLFERELAIKKGVRFPEGCFHEDEEFNTELHFHAQSLIVSDAMPYCYCKRKGSTTANSDINFERKRMEDMLKVIERITFFRSSFYEKSNSIQKRGIDRKLNTLAVDAILNMLYIGMNAKKIHATCTKRLAPLSLYPIPEASYSLKYRIFRMLANNSTGLKVLRLIVPNRKPKNR
ncbi:MAG: glycosyltransferase family 2 protein [Bacteroidaceae bacterium]|nr:glycosyltransferase family 2 protein [Bacteroidaceae bacterium]